MTEIDARTKLAVVVAAVAFGTTAPDLNAQQQRPVADSTRTAPRRDYTPPRGLIAPLVAAKEPQLRAIVLMAGPSWGGRRVLEFQLGNLVRNNTALTPAGRDSALARIPTRIDSMGDANPWMKFFLEHDVLAAARLVTQPVLVLNGATDLQVTAAQAEELAAAIRAGGNRDVTAHVFSAVNHLFIYDPVGIPSGYARLSRSALEPEVVGMLVEWLVQKMRP